MNTSLFSRGSRRLLLCVGLLSGVVLAPPAHAVTAYSFTLDTSAWTGLSGVLAFDLIGGDALASNNTLTVTALTTDGTLANAAPFTLSDDFFFNEELRDLTFGSLLGFTFELTENHAGGAFDQFSFFVLDGATLMPLFGTSDATGTDALFAVDITGAAGGNAAVFEPLSGGSGWEVEPSAAAVPDGGHAAGAVLFVVLALGAARFPASRRLEAGA